jgi:C4-dicarboxylate transporter, DctM subunit
MTVALIFILFVILTFLGVPIAFSIGFSSLFYILANGIPLGIIPQKMFTGIDSFILLSIPAFVLAGNLMNRGGLTQKIVNFGNVMVGSVRGGLAVAAVIACMVFAGISGTALAEVASIGAIMIPAMIRAGYDAPFSTGLVASASCLGPIIPPSVPMIIVGTMSGLSVSKLFAASTVPGFILGFSLIGVVIFMARKRNYPKLERASFKKIIRTTYEAFWAILMVGFLLFGILGGLFTPTEAAVVAVIYGMVVTLFITRELKIKDLPKIMLDSMLSSAAIMILVGFATLFAWIMASEQIPQLIANKMLQISSNRVVILILINLLLLFVGCFMETISALIILFPVLLKLAVGVGVDPIQFAVIMVLNLVIGLTTPPLGVCLFVAQSIGGITLGKAVRGIMPFLVTSIIVLMLVTFIPELTLVLPKILYGK